MFTIVIICGIITISIIIILVSSIIMMLHRGADLLLRVCRQPLLVWSDGGEHVLRLLFGQGKCCTLFFLTCALIHDSPSFVKKKEVLWGTVDAEIINEILPGGSPGLSKGSLF